MTNSLISADNTWALWAILTGIAALSIWLEQRYKWANRITGCVLALIGAMILSNLKIIPVDAPTYDAVWDYVVPLAIPLLLYGANIKRIWKESGKLLVVYLISGIGTVLGAILAFMALKDKIPGLYKAAAMMTGTYTGGSVNLVAMADAFEAGGELVSTSVVADNLLMAFYFFVLVAVPTMNFFLKNYKHPIIDKVEKEGATGEGKTKAAQFWGAKEISLKDIAFAVAISFIIVAISSNLADLLSSIIPTGNLGLDLLNGLLGNQYLIMTTVTMILATYFHDFFSSIHGAQEIGTFLIYIFFTVIGVPASISLIVTKSPLLLVFCAIIVFVNMLVTFLAGKVFKFNLEDMILASNANIGGPTTAAALAIAKGWDSLIVPTLLVGTLGYVIGNYYGILVGNLLQVM